jgi:hypothetical protein
VAISSIVRVILRMLRIDLRRVTRARALAMIRRRQRPEARRQLVSFKVSRLFRPLQAANQSGQHSSDFLKLVQC